MQHISIGIFDERHLIRSFIFDFLSRKKNLTIRFKAWSESFLMDALKGNTPDILLMNITLKIQPGISVILKIKKELPSLSIIAYHYGTGLSKQEIFRIINAGAACILTDMHSPDDLVQTIEGIAENGFHMNDVVNEAMFHYCKQNRVIRKSFGPEENFSEREIRIIESKRTGKTSMEIAAELFVSKKTVDGILQDMYRRYDCRNFHTLLVKYVSMLQT